MTATVSEVHLLDARSGELKAAQLLDAITEQQLEDWEAEWLPELYLGIQRLRRGGVPKEQWPQHRHWDWRRKVVALRGMLAAPGFSLVCDGVTQGMMIAETVKGRCRIDSQRGQHLVYVDYIESAPWNRPGLVDEVRYRGVGSVLVRAAIALSDDLDFQGRLGLHSLPQADRFYAEKCGMTDLGHDASHQNLRYFEMTPGQARAFVDKGGTNKGATK